MCNVGKIQNSTRKLFFFPESGNNCTPKSAKSSILVSALAILDMHSRFCLVIPCLHIIITKWTMSFAICTTFPSELTSHLSELGVGFRMQLMYRLFSYILCTYHYSGSGIPLAINIIITHIMNVNRLHFR